MVSWFIGRCSASEPCQPGCTVYFWKDRWKTDKVIAYRIGGWVGDTGTPPRWRPTFHWRLFCLICTFFTVYYSPLNKIVGKNFLRNFISTLFKTKQNSHKNSKKRWQWEKEWNHSLKKLKINHRECTESRNTGGISLQGAGRYLQ